MRTEELANAVEAWAVATIPALSSFPIAPGEISKAFPVVICEAKNKHRSTRGGDFARQQYQQTAIRSWQVELLILVDPEPDEEATKILYGYVDDLEEALTRDYTLGGRVEAASSDQVEASFEPAEVEYSDGTIARAATMRFDVGEMIGG